MDTALIETLPLISVRLQVGSRLPYLSPPSRSDKKLLQHTYLHYNVTRHSSLVTCLVLAAHSMK